MAEYYNVTEAAEKLGVSRPTVYKMMARGELEHVRITKNVTRIKRESVERVLKGGGQWTQ